MRFPSAAAPPSTLFMALRTRSSGPEIMSTSDNVANTLKTSMSYFRAGVLRPLSP